MINTLKQRFNKACLGELSGPFSVSFTVTNRCNYRCRHCYNNSGEGRYIEMADEELIDVANQICEIHPLSVCLCGGEPLVRGKVIYDIIKILKRGCGIVNIVSNGYLINEEVLKNLKEAGISTIQISLDGNSPFLHENMRMQNMAFEKAINAIRLAVKFKFKVAVSMCPNKINLDTIEDTCLLVRNLGANEFRMMPLILMGRGKNMTYLKPSADEYLILQQRIKRLEEKYNSKNFNVSWGDPLDHIYRMPENFESNMNTYSLEIRSDGKLALTTYLPIVVGDLRKKSLKEYWNNGYNNIWGNKKILRHIKNLYSTSQFASYDPEPYTGEDIVIEL